jgi:hypothetical protein
MVKDSPGSSGTGEMACTTGIQDSGTLRIRRSARVRFHARPWSIHT